MKTQRKTLLSLLLLALLVCLTACGETEAPDAGTTGPFANATYTTDTTLGTGATTIYVEVIVGEHKVTFTILTDETILADALTTVGLVDGEVSIYGLYMTVVNGITADYDVDQSYWSASINGTYADSGVSYIDVVDGTTYQLIYTKW